MSTSTVVKWIVETNPERRHLEALLGRTPATRLTAEDVKALVASLQDITATLASTPGQKAPRSTPRWESTSHTTKMAGSCSNPGRV